MLVSNKAYNSLSVYSISVLNYKNLETSLVHIKIVGVLKGYFTNYKDNFIRLISIKAILLFFCFALKEYFYIICRKLKI